MFSLLAVFPNYSVSKNSFADNLNQETNNIISYDTNKSISLNLYDTLNIQHDNSKYNPISLSTNINYKISLVDVLYINSIDQKFDQMLLVSNPYDKIKLMERIKSNEQENIFTSDDYLISNPLSVSDSQYFDHKLVDINEFNLLPFVSNYFTDNTNTKNISIDEVFKLEQLTQNFDDHLVLIFIPFIGFLFFKLEYGKVSIVRSRSSLSSFVIILLIFSAFSTPFTISFNYYGSAYAEEFSFSGIMEDDLNNNLKSNSNNGVKITIEPLSTHVVSDNYTDSSAELIIDTSTEPIINSTSVDLVNATITEPITESTENILSTELNSLQN